MLENRKETRNYTASNPRNHGHSKSHHSSSPPPSSALIEDTKEKRASRIEQNHKHKVKKRSKANDRKE